MSTQVCYGGKYETTKPVPVRFDEILNTILTTGTTRKTVDQLLVMKKTGNGGKAWPGYSCDKSIFGYGNFAA